ncbi:DUF3999 family protein [Rufibacter glacialis]|uniref:DUF3999 domain-containing protein n=1 Tax=Rufibacter glacialis TaxID=1259555 RepID=A0A5M8QM19_9BACT|nr:DUF3999 family protein [Rufibacter glacialis]KAA6437129.1 DUF3999 domain-containing protein [Rufibacter glacialis]GGK61867.1 hypothetical protein GCM10011405_07470 [Rufibacter glacialis]
MKPKLLFFLAVSAASWLSAAGQEFAWQAQLAPVTQQGFHRILLPPQVTGRLQPGLEDIRVMGPNGQPVPYVLRAEVPVQYRTLFKPYQILRYTRRPGGVSELLVHNPQKRSINNISLRIGNAEVRKPVSLSGSDDQQDWYVLKEQDVLYAIKNTRSTAEVKLLDFPLSNYRYFRLQLQDSLSAPLNILQAGYYDTYSEAGKYATIPIKAITRRDSAENHTTYLRLKFGQPVYPEQVALFISAPGLYHRPGQVIVGEQKRPERRRRKRRQARLEETSVPLLLSSNAPAVLDLPRQRVEELVIQIENGDNPPLSIDSVRVRQLNRYLVAALERGQAYTLRFGNEKAKAPEYDLQFFQDSIPAHAPVLQVQHLQSVSAPKTQKQTQSSKILVWAAIALLAIGLGFMTVRLLRDMEKK